MQQLCETSFKNKKLSAELTASCQCVLWVFHSICPKYAPATKKWSQVIRSAAPVTQNHLSKPEDLMLQNATPLRKSVPWPPNISDEHVFCTALATRHASVQIFFKCPTPAIFFGNATKPSRLAVSSLLARCRIPCTCHAKSHLNLQEWSEHVVFLTFWLGNVLRATTAYTFFNISTSKSAPKLVWFVHFDFEMCFAPQRVHFFDIKLPKVVRTWCVWYILTWKCASKSAPDVRCFCLFHLQMCFAPERPATFYLSSGQMAPHPL